MTFHSRAGDGAPLRRKQIAVVGSGAAALCAAWVLAPSHEVTLFEQNDYAGGHAHTVDVPGPDGPIAVDTGFIVYNDINYPNLVALFDYLGVATHPTTMGFAASLDGGRLEYSGGSLGGLLAQKSNLLRPRFLGMLLDLLRFYRRAPQLLAQPGAAALSLGDYLKAEGYGAGFVDDHILPMAAAIWSAPAERLLAFPAVSFVRFFQNHGLLSLSQRPQWRTVTGGSRRYIARLSQDLAGRVHLSAKVVRVERAADGVTLTTADGNSARFDEIVLGCHADESLALLADASDAESDLLGAFRFETNAAWLHTDASLMPKRRATWSAWNYLGDSQVGQARRLAVTYWMNELQGLDPRLPLFITLNPPRPPAAGTVFGRFDYDHPIFDAGAMAAQGRLPDLQGQRHSWFCGAWCGYGFHEDAFASGLRVAAGLGCLPPWSSPAPATLVA
jgi:predicted NAD/FAD-binding protein